MTTIEIISSYSVIVRVSVVLKRIHTHPDDHTTRTPDIPGFKPFTLIEIILFDIIG